MFILPYKRENAQPQLDFFDRLKWEAVFSEHGFPFLLLFYSSFYSYLFLSAGRFAPRLFFYSLSLRQGEALFSSSAAGPLRNTFAARKGRKMTAFITRETSTSVQPTA